MNQGQGAALPPVTDWFPGDVKPVRPGVYEREFAGGRLFARWAAGQWNQGWNSIAMAEKEHRASINLSARWRGLSANPAQAGLGAMAVIAADTLNLPQPVRPSLIRATSTYFSDQKVAFTVEFTDEGKAALKALGHNRGLILQSAIEAALRGGA